MDRRWVRAGFLALIAVAVLWFIGAVALGADRGSRSRSEQGFLFHDDFDDTASGWPQLGESWGGAGYRSGEYSIWLNDPDDWNWSWAPEAPSDLPEFEMEATAYKHSGGDDASYGIFWGIDDDNRYLFEVSADGYYAVFHKRHGEWQTNPVDWTESSAVRQRGQLNRLGVIVENGRATLFVNDIKLKSFNLSMGGPYWVGVAAESWDTAPVEVRFTEFEVRDLSEEASGPSTPSLAIYGELGVLLQPLVQLGVTAAMNKGANSEYREGERYDLTVEVDRESHVKVFMFAADGKAYREMPFVWRHIMPENPPAFVPGVTYELPEEWLSGDVYFTVGDLGKGLYALVVIASESRLSVPYQFREFSRGDSWGAVMRLKAVNHAEAVGLILEELEEMPEGSWWAGTVCFFTVR